VKTFKQDAASRFLLSEMN